MVHPSRNLWLNEGGIRKRGGTTPVDATPMTDSPEVNGLFDHRLANGNQHIVRGTADGKLWKSNIATIKTGLGTSKYPYFSQWGDELIITNGNNIPMTWNGVAAAVTNLTVGVKAQGVITMAGIATVGVVAEGTITMAGIAVAYETFVIDDQTFVWKPARAKKGEVEIGTDAAEAVVNLAYAINADMSGAFTADDISTSTVLVTAVVMEAAANTKIFTEASTNMTMDGSGTFGETTAGVDEDTFVIDEQTFTWKEEREEGATGEVKIGASASEAVTNLVAAINEDSDTVEAEDSTGDTVVITAVDYGTDANSMVFTEASTNMTMNGSGTLGETTAGIRDMMPADWTGTNYPKQIVLHGRGNSMRGWAVGCPSNPKNIYASANDDPTDFAQATVLLFHIETGDGSGIMAGVKFGDRLVLLSKTKPFIFNDNDTNTDNWGYTSGQWEGGVAHHRLLVKTPNDLVAMMENGEIYSVSTAEQYGDYKAASLTRPSFMHEWIKEYINLSQINKFHALYDPILRAINFFVVRTGSSEVDTCLCYFIDRPPNKAWVILDNQDFESGYSAVSSAMVRASAGSWKIYTGSYNGEVWKLGEVNRNDEDEAFQARYKTPSMTFDNARETKRYDKVKIVAVREGTCKATLTWWIDGQLIDAEDLEFSAGGALLGAFILGESPLGGQNVLEESVTIGCVGKRIQLEIKNNVANEGFFFSQMLVDFVPLGKRI